MRFDERLGLSDAVKSDLASLVCGSVPHVLLTSRYHVPLTIDLADDGEVYVRAATGAEVVDELAFDVADTGNGSEWLGGAVTALGRTLRWQEHAADIASEGQAVLIWEAEVLLRNGRGQGGSFFVHETAASAEAFSSALALGAQGVFECQVVPYACAKQHALALIQLGDAEARRLTQFAVSPLQPFGAPRPIPLAPAHS